MQNCNIPHPCRESGISPDRWKHSFWPGWDLFCCFRELCGSRLLVWVTMNWDLFSLSCFLKTSGSLQHKKKPLQGPDSKHDPVPAWPHADVPECHHVQQFQPSHSPHYCGDATRSPGAAPNAGGGTAVLRRDASLCEKVRVGWGVVTWVILFLCAHGQKNGGPISKPFILKIALDIVPLLVSPKCEAYSRWKPPWPSQ